ncbi:unnamed protein product [Pieris macdunnoughi]|uniref:Tyr recombinase domain-containing protein n=1 Tax=Pieris macdunnoughi TaxID=345717 RepID=A0A821R6V8_9NEOP|nr:unnamed protein product [Pieris macdunnoughi]
MKKMDGEDYKESTIKTMWNQTAKLLQEKYLNDFDIKINPFSDAAFKTARGARDAKRKALQSIPEKRRASAAALEEKDWDTMTTVWDEETPDGLQKKLFMIISVELAWRGGEGSMASIHHFKAEQRNDGETTGRIEYNPIFSKTTQVRLFQKLREKRDANIKSDRLFLTQNPFWNKVPGARWYKDSPVGQNTISKWVKESAQKAGLDLGNKKITNHSSRATAVSNLAKSGLGEQQIIKITGHANSNSIKPYLQLDQEHHELIVKKLRRSEPTAENAINSINLMPSTSSGTITDNSDLKKTCTNVYNNCIFNCTILNLN